MWFMDVIYYKPLKYYLIETSYQFINCHINEDYFLF